MKSGEKPLPNSSNAATLPLTATEPEGRRQSASNYLKQRALSGPILSKNSQSVAAAQPNREITQRPKLTVKRALSTPTRRQRSLQSGNKELPQAILRVLINLVPLRHVFNKQYGLLTVAVAEDSVRLSGKFCKQLPPFGQISFCIGG